MFTIKNKRYQVPDSFLERHPGGKTLIELGKGRNCTALFVSYHSLCEGRPQDVLAKFDTGQVAVEGDADYEDLYDWDATPFFTALVTRVKQHFGPGQAAYKATADKWAVIAVFLCLFVISGVAWFQGKWWSLVTLPVCYWVGASTLMHDGTHSSLSTDPRINFFCAALGSYHMDMHAWLHQHVVGHHAHTNILDVDPDLHHFEGKSTTAFGHRLHPEGKWYLHYGRWLKSLIVTIPFTGVQPSFAASLRFWFVGDFDGIVTQTVDPGMVVRSLYVLQRFALLALMLVTPFYYQGSLLKALAFATIPHIIYGCIYYIMSQISHINKECFSEGGEAPHSSNGKKMEWAIWQIRHAVDWGPATGFWRYASIGLNSQVVHHLFPQVDSSHYWKLRQITLKVCNEFNVPYVVLPNFYTAVSKHFQWVISINSKE